MSFRLIILSLISLAASILIYQNRVLLSSSGLGSYLIPLVTGGRISMAADGKIFINDTRSRTSTAISSELPENFPSDLPVFPGANIDLGLSRAEEDSVSVNLTTSYPMRRVVNYYKRWLTKRGWQTTTLQDNNSGYKLLIKNNIWEGNLWVSPATSGTQIAIDLYR